MSSSPPLSREEIAKLEIGHTEIAGWLARTMTAAFLFALFAVPLLHEMVPDDGESRTLATWPRCCQIFTTLPELAVAFRQSEGNLWQRTLTANARLLKNIDLYESGLKDESLLVQRLLCPTQYCLTKWGRLGNEKAYLGRDGWLFYRPGVDYVSGPGFLEPRVLAKRSQAGKPYAAPPQPDPRPAIDEFARQLRRRGITLLLVPAPGKASIHPERLSSRYSAASEPLQNESFARWKQEIEREGVLVFDPAPLLHDLKLQTGRDQYLKADTHWTAEAAVAVAQELARFIEARAPLPARAAVQYRAQRRVASGVGDIAAMLRLPDDAELCQPETVEIRQIAAADGTPWQPDVSADVLLLGDSFTNIYSQETMRWGSAAGLAEQLSFELHRPLDRISQNDAGAYATRQTLAGELARGDNRLSGKRLVIWEFAARELAVGDWKMISLADAAPVKARGSSDDQSPASSPSSTVEGEIVVRGTIEAAAGVPRPGSVPYREAVMAVHLSGVEAREGTAPGDEIVVYLFGMRDNRWTPAARYQPGERVTLKLQSWDQVRAKYGSLNRIELDDPDFKLIDLPLFWGEESQ
ncbi:MAG TPA: hypothetical protein VJ783_00385 [Pirellulales bacterium]|nr:hypothetical protein [Pirellulales bacterium]